MNVIVDTGFINSLVYGYVVVGILIAVIIAYIGIKRWRTPKESNEIYNCAVSKKGLNIIATDERKFKFRHTDKTGPEGVVMTKPEGKEKRHWTGFLARRGKTANILVADQVVNGSEGTRDDQASAEKTALVQEKTELLAAYINSLMSNRCYLEGARIPVSFAVEGKALVADIYGIAGIQITEAIKNIFEEFPVDVSALKRMVVSNSWNESQINAQEEDMKALGKLETKRQTGLKESYIPWLIGGGIFFGGLAAVIAVVTLL